MAVAYINAPLRFIETGNPAQHPYAVTPYFSENLVGISGGGFGNLYTGVFEQAEDSRISGIVTGASGYYVTDIHDLSRPNLSPTFNITGLEVDFAALAAELAFDSPTRTPEALLFAGDDWIAIASIEAYGFVPELQGYGGDDILNGTNATDDRLWGGTGDDKLYGFAGDNIFVGGAGDDAIHATPASQDDVNTAVYSGASSAYTILLGRGGYYGVGTTITDRVSDRDGTDTLYEVDQLAFVDQTLSLELTDIPFTLSNTQIADIASLYIAYFDRAPDAFGLHYWMARAQEGMSLEEISGYFSRSVEAGAAFPLYGPSEPVVQAVYAHVLNRAPDAEGLAFWTQMLKEDLVSRGNFVLELLRGAAAGASEGESPEISAQRDADAAYLEAKTNLGLYFSGVRGLNDLQDAEVIFEGFDGSTASMAAGKALVDGFYAEATDPESGALLIQLSGVLDDPFYI